nr:transcriptional regulator [Anaerolineae bacterium]
MILAVLIPLTPLLLIIAKVAVLRKRILLLYALADGPRRVTDLAEALGVPQPTVSHHLKILRERGLVVAEREGTAAYYSLADQRVIQALDLLRAMLADLLAQQADLAEHISGR